MNRLRRLQIFVLLMILNIAAFAQNNVQMADTMRAEGKIYVVVAMILIIVTGFLIYLFTLDKRIKRLEKELKSKGH